jgi:polygalacturonase
MANVKISQLPLATSPLDSSVEMPVVQGGVTKRAGMTTIGFLQSGTSAVLRTAQAKMQDVVSVKDFGAVGDGVANDTAAIQAAASSGAKSIHIPAGRYYLTAPITFTGAVTLTGEGMASTLLEWTTGNGLSFVGVAGDNMPVTMRDFTVLKVAGAANGNAITVNNAAQISGGNIQNRTSPRLVIENVAVKGSGTVFDSGWVNGLQCQSVLHATVSGFHFEGRTNALQTVMDSAVAMQFFGSGSPVEIVIENSWAFYAQSAVSTTDCEGVFVSGCNFVGVNVGLVFSGAAAEPQLNLVDNHINANVACVQATNLAQASIAHNLFYARDTAPANVVGIQLSTCQTVNIDDNIFVDTSSFNFDGIVFSSGTTLCNARGNTFQSTTTSVWMQAGSTNNTATGNTFVSVTTRYLDQGTGNIVSTASLAESGFDTSVQGVITKWGTAVSTLNASGDGTVTFPSAFKNAFYAAVISSGDPSIASGAAFALTHTSCSTTTLAFSVRPNPGAIPVRVNYVAFGS